MRRAKAQLQFLSACGRERCIRSGQTGRVVALDASTGKELWTHRFLAREGRRRSGPAGPTTGKVKDHSDRRIFLNGSGFMYAINAEPEN